MATLSGILGSQFSGSTGPAGTITIGTVTSGGTPSVTNVGTATAAVLNFNLPVGTFTWPGAGIPVSTGYTFVLSDANKAVVQSGASSTVTIPANSSVAYPVGTTLTVVNNTSGNISIAITTDTMYLGGTATTGTRTLAQRGIATAYKVSSTVWFISGAGLT